MSHDSKRDGRTSRKLFCQLLLESGFHLQYTYTCTAQLLPGVLKVPGDSCGHDAQLLPGSGTSCLLFDRLPNERENGSHSCCHHLRSRLSSGPSPRLKQEKVRGWDLCCPTNNNNLGAELDVRVYSFLKPLRKTAPLYTSNCQLPILTPT